MWLAREKKVAIIGLNYKDNRDDALVWLDRLGDPYRTVIYDPKGMLGFDLGVYGAPETFVIDASGVVRYRHVGVVNGDVWEQVLLPVINEARGTADAPYDVFCYGGNGVRNIRCGCGRGL